MKSKKIFRFTMSVVLLLFFVTAAAPAWAEDVTVIGTLNDENQLVTAENVVYEIGDTEMADSLLENIGAKVSVVGAVVDEDGIKTINVISFEVME